jgi:hypothetical protein
MLAPTRYTYQKPADAPALACIESIYAKVCGELYRVELKYKVNGLFCLRPTNGRPYGYLLLTAEQVKSFPLFPIAGVNHGA